MSGSPSQPDLKAGKGAQTRMVVLLFVLWGSTVGSFIYFSAHGGESEAVLVYALILSLLALLYIFKQIHWVIRYLGGMLQIIILILWVGAGIWLVDANFVELGSEPSKDEVETENESEEATTNESKVDTKNSFGLTGADLLLILLCPYAAAIGLFISYEIERFSSTVGDKESSEQQEKKHFQVGIVPGLVLGLVIALYLSGEIMTISGVLKVVGLSILAGYQSPNLWMMQERMIEEIVSDEMAKIAKITKITPNKEAHK